MGSIMTSGLKPMRRQYVHLTEDRLLALTIGGRHGKPRLIQVDAGRVHQQGIRFYRAHPQFWLADEIPSMFLSCLEPPGDVSGVSGLIQDFEPGAQELITRAVIKTDSQVFC